MNPRSAASFNDAAIVAPPKEDRAASPPEYVS